MKKLNTDNVLGLFKGWEKKLPYNTSGRPSYSSDEYKQYEEVFQIDFLLNDKPSKIIVKRLLGGSTNYYWGMRDFGMVTNIIIGEVNINTDKFISKDTYQYGTRFVIEMTKPVKAPLTRILEALQQDKEVIPMNELFYWEDRQIWVQVKYVADFDIESDSFMYGCVYTPQGSATTYIYNITGKYLTSL